MGHLTVATLDGLPLDKVAYQVDVLFGNSLGVTLFLKLLERVVNQHYRGVFMLPTHRLRRGGVLFEGTLGVRNLLDHGPIEQV